MRKFILKSIQDIKIWLYLLKKPKIGYLKEVNNKAKKNMEQEIYYHVKVKYNGGYKDFLFTKNQLDVADCRANNNTEDFRAY